MYIGKMCHLDLHVFCAYKCVCENVFREGRSGPLLPGCQASTIWAAC